MREKSRIAKRSVKNRKTDFASKLGFLDERIPWRVF